MEFSIYQLNKKEKSKMNSDSYYSSKTTILFYFGDNIKKNEMGAACNMHVGE
jgi:hypothetical protein